MAIALYARKSVERENSISCETQIEYCKAAIRIDERNKEILTFIDNGFSGGNMNRDGFQNMMALVQKHRIEKVIVYKLDRISRSLSDFVSILNVFKQHNVDFISSQESFDTSSPYGEMIVKILMVFAEFERASTIARVTQAYEHRSNLGLYMGGRIPYGFTLTETVIAGIKTKELKCNPEEIETVKYIYKLYSLGTVTLRKIVKIMVTENRYAENGWSIGRVRSILKNPIYVKADVKIYDYYECLGVNIMSDISTFDGKRGIQLYGKTKQKSFDETKWEELRLVVLGHEGVIDSTTWLTCQEYLKENKKLGDGVSKPNTILTGIVYCGCCGGRMFLRRGRPNKKGIYKRYLVCGTKFRKMTCNGPEVTIIAGDIENVVEDSVIKRLEEIQREHAIGLTNDTEEIDSIKLQIKSIEVEQYQIAETIMGSVLSPSLISIMDEKATKLEKVKKELQEQMQNLREQQEGRERVIDLLNEWKNADDEQKRVILAKMISKVVINIQGDIEIKWRL